MADPSIEIIRDILIYRAALDMCAQKALLADIRSIIQVAPLFTPKTPYGRAMSVRMSAAGEYGWFSDRAGYRYMRRHPIHQTPWPPIPDSIITLWRRYADDPILPQCCLINYYGENARMGLHQDKDEADFSHPVLSLSLGDSGLFRIGNQEKGGKTQSTWLKSGDILCMQGKARLLYHGIDKIAPSSSALLPKGGRINLTLRVVD